MKYSIGWLNELARTNLTPKEMAELFTRYSFEVDGFEEGVEISDQVVVGKIVEVSPHPNAEKLSLTKVTVDPEERVVLDIVCGAKNIASGDVVPVAMVGAVLPNGLVIKESLIRGEKSQGMLCAEDELGLGEDHSGILHLPKNTILGTPVSKVLKQKDAIIDLSVLSSRGHDALCHAGMAREVVAMAGQMENGKRIENEKWRMKNEKWGVGKRESDLKILLKNNQREDVRVEIAVKEKCARYIGIRLTNIRNGASPEWMQERLLACGMRPISVVVDVTNYVMLEMGQPLHAFDFQKIKSEFPISNFQFPNKISNLKSHISNNSQLPISNFQIHVRNAKEGEKMTLLDDSEIELHEEDIVIANDSEVLALAGVMGGKKSGTSPETTEVFLEAANFDSMSIRKTRVRHKLSTESAYRFERDIDPNQAEVGIMRASTLLQELAGAKVVSGTDEYLSPVVSWTIDLDLYYVEKLLGIVIPEEEIIHILESLGVTVDRQPTTNDKQQEVESSLNQSSVVGRQLLVVTIPTQRRDLHTQEDLIEEIGRLYGYERIAPKAPMVSLETPLVNAGRAFERKLKDGLVASGCDEILSYSFYKKETAGIFDFPLEKHFTLQNPMNPDQQLFRTNVLPNALEKVRENLRYFDAVSIFEIGKVYEKGGDGEVREKKSLVVLESGTEDCFVTLKGRLESLFDFLGMSGVSYEPKKVQDGYFHKTRTAEVTCRGKKIGTLGEISPLLLREAKCKKRIALFEADFDRLLSVISAKLTYAPLPKFPFVWRDMSLIVPLKVTSAEVTHSLQKSLGKTLKVVELFDVYEKEGEKSFAYHLAFGDDARTLTKDEVEEMFQKCLVDLGRLEIVLKM